MNRAQLRMHKLLERFKDDLENKTIGEYFQVPLDITINNDVYELRCKFSKKKECYVKLELPFEVNCIVLSYLYEHSYGIFQINIPDDYPFKPPMWKLLHSNDVKYKKAEMYQNAQYRHSWEPSISVEKDILYMIQSIYLNYES
jgi:ubiquitin-protein ligase